MARFVGTDRILVARDMRESGVALAAAFSDGVRAEGVDIVDLGMASTDFLYFASGHLDSPGAMFTASHNPAQYNGLKLCLSGARPIGRDTGLADIEAGAEELLGRPLPPLTGGWSEQNLLDEWADHVVSFVDVGSLRPLKVVADTANGMGGLVVPIVFERLPFTVDILFPELDGNFPNHPAGIVFTGDILFHGGHPIVWAGPVANWITACDRVLALHPTVVVPGHGPLATPAALEDLKAYFELLTREARARFDTGMTALDAARDIDLGPYTGWSEAERVVANVHALYRDFGDPAPSDALTLMGDMAALAG